MALKPDFLKNFMDDYKNIILVQPQQAKPLDNGININVTDDFVNNVLEQNPITDYIVHNDINDNNKKFKAHVDLEEDGITVSAINFYLPTGWKIKEYKHGDIKGNLEKSIGDWNLLFNRSSGVVLEAEESEQRTCKFFTVGAKVQNQLEEEIVYTIAPSSEYLFDRQPQTNKCSNIEYKNKKIANCTQSGTMAMCPGYEADPEVEYATWNIKYTNGSEESLVVKTYRIGFGRPLYLFYQNNEVVFKTFVEMNDDTTTEEVILKHFNNLIETHIKELDLEIENVELIFNENEIENSYFKKIMELI